MVQCLHPWVLHLMDWLLPYGTDDLRRGPSSYLLTSPFYD